MPGQAENPDRLAARRDAALARLRRLTRIVAAGALAAAAAVGGGAAASTHHKKAATTTTSPSPQGTPTLPPTSATPPPPTTTQAARPLHGPPVGTSGGSWTPSPRGKLVELDAAQRRARIPKGIELDLGATAKALAADRAAAAAHELTGTAVLVSLGGDVSVAGPPPDAGWPVRIADDHAAPLDEGGPVLAVAAGGLATSGTSVRRWKAGGVTLHHIIDPQTGRPAETPWRTVTVAARTCVEANVASTAAVVLGDEAPAWLVARGLPARLVAAHGAVVTVAAWPEEAAA